MGYPGHQVHIRTCQCAGIAGCLAQPVTKLGFPARHRSNALGNASRCGKLDQWQRVLRQFIRQQTRIQLIGRGEFHRAKSGGSGGFDTLQKRQFVELEAEVSIEFEHV
ncbi:hypothetical protein D9M68_915780 [compost metagenome]